MPDQTVVPSENRVWLTGNRWAQSQGFPPDMWQLIDNGVSTPVDLQRILSLADLVDEDFGFNTITLPAAMGNIHTLTIQFRYYGFPLDSSPKLIFEVWTDYPTTLARKIGESDLLDINTGGLFVNGQFTLDSLTVSRDEVLALRVVPISRATGAAGGPPEPYIE
jgi:hypothetical protein